MQNARTSFRMIASVSAQEREAHYNAELWPEKLVAECGELTLRRTGAFSVFGQVQAVLLGLGIDAQADGGLQRQQDEGADHG